MAISRKLDDETCAQLWTVFFGMSMWRNKVIVDFHKNTIEAVETEYQLPMKDF